MDEPVGSGNSTDLTPLIKGRHRTLWTDHQEILTAWLLKTCMVFEFTADPEREPYYTFAERQGMAEIASSRRRRTFGSAPIWATSTEGGLKTVT
jgi:hypothetical protein